MNSYIDKYNVRGKDYAMKDNYSGYITQAAITTHNLDVEAHPGLSPTVHIHDDRYYTESEIDILLDGLEPYVLPDDVVQDADYVHVTPYVLPDDVVQDADYVHVTPYVLPDNVVTTEDLATFKTALFLEIYPVGKTYISTDATSPATLFGGTWVQLKDRFLLGAGDDYSAGDTGGEATVTLDNTTTGRHTHPIHINTFTDAGSISGWNCLKASMAGGSGIGTVNGNLPVSTRIATENTDGGHAHNNMPPYEVVYMWKRTA